MDDRNVLNHISSSYYQLTAKEKKVAVYLLSHLDEVQFMSISSWPTCAAWRRPPSPASAAV